MDRSKFESEITRWAEDVISHAIRLHDAGVPSEHCVRLASDIATQMATKRAMDRARLAAGVGPLAMS